MGNRFSKIEHLVERYYDGLYHCDTDILRSVFHDEAHYFTASSTKLVHYDMPAYMEAIENRLSPAERGDPYWISLDSISFAGDRTALATLRCVMLGNLYTDFLSLIFIDNEWRIIAKTFDAYAVTAAEVKNLGVSQCLT